jgi:peptide-N4-(N-acetyl-beta-glucosaminyl)asparagine amidase
MLFGAILSSLGIKARIVHDFLDHCWNEAMLQPDGQWVHIDSTLDYPISLNHPYYYEENWGKEYKYVLAFSADNVEDVTQRYTLQWEAIKQRRLKNKKNAMDFPKFYSGI